MWPIEFEEWMDRQKNDGHIATVSCTQSFGENEIGMLNTARRQTGAV